MRDKNRGEKKGLPKRIALSIAISFLIGIFFPFGPGSFNSHEDSERVSFESALARGQGEKRDLKKRYKIKFGEDEAEIGDFKTRDFKPHLKLKRWGEECFLSVEVPDTQIPERDKVVGRQADKIEWETPGLGSRFYKKGRQEITQEVTREVIKRHKIYREIEQRVEEKSVHKFIKNENGGLEFEIVLKELPAANIIRLPIETQGLEFYYQGPLTQAQIDQGIVRPDEAVGSYALYHESKKDGQYQTGKAFHIYRPKIIDRNGEWVWGSLNIDTQSKVLEITIEQAWLNTATYPVVVDPEFGYTSIGSSAIPIGDIVRGSIFTALVMTPDSISAYLENSNSSATQTAKYAIYLAEDSSLVGETLEVTLPPSGAGWYEGLYTTPLNLSAIDYALVALGSSQDVLIYFDEGAVNQGVSQEKDYTQAWPETATFAYDNNMYSIYDATTATFKVYVYTDCVAPTGSIGYSPNRAVRDADTLTITAYFNEAITSAPTIAIDYAGIGSDLPATPMTQGANNTIWTYSANIPAGNDGTATITIAGTDIAGNSIGTVFNNNFAVDNTAPNAPTAATIASGSGWNTNYITPANQSAVKVSGTKSTDTTQIKIEIDDEDTFASAKTTTLSGLGAVTTYADATGIDVTTATALADGTIAVRITAYDAAGNTSTQTVLKTAGTFNKDTTAPTAPSAATIASGSGWNTNYISDANKAAVKVSGTKSTDTVKIKIEIDDEDTFASAKTTTLSGLGAVTTYADATGIDVTTATALADGTIAVRITAYDAAGNTSTQTVLKTAGTFNKDTTAPTAPSAATIASGSGWNTNYISDANKAAVKVSGTKSTDTVKIKIEIDDEDTFASAKTTTLSGLGAVTTYADATGIDVTTATALADGTIAVRITAYDAAENSSTQTVLKTAGTFNKDTTAPTAPSAATIASGSGWNTNYISDANKAAVKVSGTKSTDTVKIKIEIDDEDTFASAKTTTLSGLGSGTTYADATGIDVTTATALADGTIAVRITAYDAAENSSTQTVLKTAGTFNKDTTAPTAPSAATIASGSGWNTNYISDANKAAVKVSGTKSTDTVKIKIEIDDEDTFASAKTTTLSGLGSGTTYADATGIDVTTATALADGTIAVRITAYDAAENSSTQTVLKTAGTFNKDTTAPNAPSAATIASGSGWNTNYISDANKAAVKVSGTKSTDTVKIKIEIDDEDTFASAKTTTLSGLGAVTTYADATGIDVTTATALADGTIAVRITAYDAAENSSTQTVLKTAGTFNKDTTAPNAPTGVSFTAVGGTVVANVLNTTNTNFTAQATITAGQATGGSAELLKGGVSFTTPIGDTSIVSGDTTVTFDAGLTTNPQVQAVFASSATVSVKLTDAAGNSSTSSVANPSITVDYVAPSGLGNFSAATPTLSTSVMLSWSIVSDANWTGTGHYEIWYGTSWTFVEARGGGDTLEWDNDNDSNLSNIATTTTTITGLVQQQTYYFKIWAVDNAGNEATITRIFAVTNARPVGGYTADNIIPEAQCFQSTDGSGIITITFKIKDRDTLNSFSLHTFQYSVNGNDSPPTWTVPNNLDSSASLSTNWTSNGYTSAADFATATAYSFTFNTKQADVSGLNNVDQSDVRIRFTVNDGLENSDLPATSDIFRVDDAVPIYSPTTLTYSPDRAVREADTLNITANFNENLAASPTIAIDYAGTGSDLTATAMSQGADATVWTYAANIPSGNDGTATITIVGTDLKGNALATQATNNTFTVDNAAPTFTIGYYTDLACTTAFTNNYMKVGTYYIKITSNETLSSTPTISIAAEGSANDITGASTTLLSGNNYRYTRTIASDALAVGSVAEVITITGTDVAGNTATNADVTGEKYTDTTAPTVSTLTQNDADSIVRDADTITITATFNESMTSSPTISINAPGTGADITGASMSGSGITWTYAWDVPTGSTYDGSATATVAGADIAGNSYAGTDSLTWTIDNSAPTVSSLTQNDADSIVRDADTVTITSTFNESMTSSPTISINAPGTGADITGASMSGSGTTWTYAWNVPTGSSYDGLATATVAGTDIAGNSYAGTDSLTWTIDNTQATFTIGYYTDSACTTSFTNSYMKVGTYYIKITSNEALSSAPTISIAAEGTANDVSGAATTLLSGNNYRYTRTIVSDAAAVGSVAEVITITGTDTAGNTATNADVTGEKYTDTTAPVVAAVIDEGYYTASNWSITGTVKGTFTDAGGLVATTGLQVSIKREEGATDQYWNGTNWDSTTEQWNNATQGSNTWTYSLDNANLTTGRTYEVRAKATDNAGNETTSATDSFVYIPILRVTRASGSGDVTAGNTVELTITATDYLGTTVTSYTGNKSLIFSGPSNSPNGTVPTVETVNVGTATTVGFTSGVSNSLAATLIPYLVESFSLDVQDANYSTINSTASIDYDLDLTVIAAAYNYFKVTGTASMTAGGSNELSITAYDAYGNVATSYGGAGGQTKSLTFSGPGTAPDGTAPTVEGTTVGSPTSVTFTNGVSASGSTTLKAYKAETTTVDVSDGTRNSTGDASYDLDLTVNPNTVSSISFTTQPSSTATAGVDFTTQPVITLYDTYSNVCTNNSTRQVTLSAVLASDNTVAGGGTLNGTLTVTASSGVVTYSGLDYTKAENIDLKAISTGLTTIYSNQIAVSPNTVVSMSFTTQPSSTATAGVDFTTQPVITLYDVYNNICTNNSTTQVTLSAVLASDNTVAGGGTLNGTLAVTAASGVVTYSGLDYTKAENIDLKATSTGLTTIYSDQISVSPAPTYKYILNAPADITAGGTRAAYTVTRYDQYDNLVTSGAETVYLYTSSTGTNAAFKDAATLGNTIISKQISSGSNSANFWYYDEKSGNWTITATDATPADGTTGIDDATDALTVIPASASKYKVTAGASTMTAGGSLAITVTANDTYDNVDTNYDYDTLSARQVTFSGANSSSDPVTAPTCTDYGGTARIFGIATALTFTDGVATSTMKLYKAEVAHIKATVGSITTVDADDLDVTVSSGTASKLSWGTFYAAGDKVVKNAPWNRFTVNVSDGYGNVASSSADVTVTPTGGTATAGSTTTVASSSGVSTFTNFAVTCPSYPGSVTLVASATGLTSSSASNAVTVEENYAITYTVKDSLTAATLSAVTLTVYNSAGSSVYAQTKNGVFDDISIPYDSGGYTFQAAKDAYVTDSQTKTPISAEDGADGSFNNAISWIAYMTSVTEATADYQVKSSFVYTEPAYESDGTTLKSGTDQLSIRLWLERRGILITDTDINKLGSASVVITTNESTGATTTVDLGSNSNGLFWTTISTITTDADGLTLVAGRTYYARCNIPWGGTSDTSSSRRTYTAGTTFTITVSEKIKELETLTNTIKTVTDAIQAATTTIASQTTSIKEAVRQDAETITETLTTRMGKVLTATGIESLPTKIETERARIITQLAEEVEPHIVSGILNRETVVKQGDTTKIRYRTTSGLSPTITVYDPSNIQRVASAKMTEIGTTGVYEYDLTFTSGWGAGDYTILTSESTKGTLDALIMTALTTDIEQVAGQVAAILGTTAGITDLDQTVSTLDSQLATILTAITSLTTQAGETVEQIATESLEPIVAALKKVASDMKSLGGTEGYDLDDLYDISDKQSKDIKYLSNKTIELRKLLDLIRDLMEKKLEGPVIKTWYESGSVILRVLIVNPSKATGRSVPFKYYLPKEVKKEHILDMGDLELGYDTQQSLYYVHKDLELKPVESRRLAVEIEDVWVIDDKEIKSLEEQSQKFYANLKDSPYLERADYLMMKIKRDLQQILHRQTVAAGVNPEEHISIYRENTKALDGVKEDLLEMERLISRLPRISPALTWRMIIMIIVFIGILSLVFFFVWQRKLGEVSPAQEEPTKKEEAAKIVEAETRQAKEEKKVDIEDIKKRLGEPGEPKV